MGSSRAGRSRPNPDRPGAQQWVPSDGGVPALRRAATECRGCELWEPAEQLVFSEGDPGAAVVLVGEQPGDVEDREGRPFVGPAGQLLRRALGDAGLTEEEVYLTNAVKHFRFQPRGKRRIHQKPDLSHLVACRPWLEAELAEVDPAVTVALGATAARQVLGRQTKIGENRGRLLDPPEGHGSGRALVTAHPSAVLRARERRHAAYEELVADLRVVADHLAATGG
ncbi:UdgX family uracil-DNA binding protein [Ornithinicoccus halotolerans]|uniref:UdgX family uracil-DNA binding protein n=1 Tax=Ornithinicoccus halotolerans TaxID=1748220 RepID=UPI0012959212|nr:UdgX family uracil-DNA binding protein [Ornithinicoccus halotolerans]